MTVDDSSGSDDRIGRLVDERYKILEAMASGAMGAVYRAERIPVGKIVAIKFLHKSYAKDSEFLIRFERETRAMSKLAHPNCVSVVDFGVWEDSPYLVMDYVAGTTLRAILDDVEIVPQRALALGRQIAAGVAHAHAQGIVHRDIKPANIMISNEVGTGEHVRLLDFGLARLRGVGARDATQANVVVGTPNYMAPEQTVPGQTVDARADVYAIGVVLYEMIAGERPFSAPDTLALLGMHRAAPIPRLADKLLDPSVLPDGIQDVIDTAMAKSADDRYQTALELAEAIESVQRAGRPEVVSTKKRVGQSERVAAAVAPTMVDEVATVPSTRPPRMPTEPVKTHQWRLPLVGASILVVGVLGITLFLLKAHDDEVAVVDAGPKVAATKVDAAAPVIDAHIEVPIDAAVVIDAAESPDADSGSGSGSGSGEIEMDPVTADDPDPHAKEAAEDEAPNAPKSSEEVEKVSPPSPPALATTVQDAVQLIKDGKRDLALASLRELRKKSPDNSYIPFLLGNLYYDQRWWGVAMDFYRVAIQKNSQYRENAILNRNVIRMLASPKTQATATTFLKKTIGKPALPYLKVAAQHEDNSTVRKYAAIVAKQIK